MPPIHRLLLGLLGIVAAGGLAIAAQGPAKPGRVEFMREKLNRSKQILDGLAREDYPQITQGAQALKGMRESREWTKLSRPEAQRYAAYSMEQRVLADELIARAAQKNLDGATQTYLRLTTNCINCHKELRAGRQ